MSNLEKASRLLHDWADMHSLDVDMYHAARKLLEAGLLAPDVSIIRTPEEMEALDPDACTLDKYGDFDFAKDWIDENGKMFVGHVAFLPAVVIATGARVREAREAMEIEND